VWFVLSEGFADPAADEVPLYGIAEPPSDADAKS